MSREVPAPSGAGQPSDRAVEAAARFTCPDPDHGDVRSALKAAYAIDFPAASLAGVKGENERLRGNLETIRDAATGHVPLADEAPLTFIHAVASAALSTPEDGSDA